MTAAVAAARRERLLGPGVAGSSRAFDIEVRTGAGAYVCGEETSLLESLEGERGIVRAKPPLPAHIGLFGRPTVINNVLSLASVPIVLAQGAAHYRDFGMGRSRGTMPIQLAGNVRRGGLFETAFGITLGELVDDVGGGTASGRPVRAVQVGGPLGAYFPRALFDTPFDYEAFAARDGLIGHGGIVVFDDTVAWRSRRASPWNSAPSNPAASARRAASARPAASRPSTASFAATIARITSASSKTSATP
jgi:formate dehydrogenase iron-sulfur subunit